MMIPPKKIVIPSDGNEMEFDATLKHKNGVLHQYRYTKSETKLHSKIAFTEDILNNYIKHKLFITAE